MKRFLAAVTFLLIGMANGDGRAWAGPTFDTIRTNGAVTCGLSTGLAGFAVAEKDTKPVGLDADICRAVAAAIFGTPDKVKFVGVTADQRISALQSGQVDLEVIDAAIVVDKLNASGVSLAPAVFYDGAGFLVPRSLGVRSARQLSGATVCYLQASPDEQHLANYFHGNKLDLKPAVYKSVADIDQAFFYGRCDAYMTDVLALANMRITKAVNPEDFTILPERISKSQLAPALRNNDKGFYNLVRWTVFTLIEAEERGVTARNAADLVKSDDPGLRHLLGTEPDTERALSPDDKRAVNVIRAVGNYGEIFARNIGEQSQLRLARGQNALFLNTVNGLIASPQVQ
jgi:general L-amino acid transport system substrate-binding protein